MLTTLAWSLSVKEEQWHMVKPVMAYESKFDPDRSLLKWSAGAYLLKFAIAMYDEDLLRTFSRHVIYSRVFLMKARKLAFKGTSDEIEDQKLESNKILKKKSPEWMRPRSGRRIV